MKGRRGARGTDNGDEEVINRRNKLRCYQINHESRRDLVGIMAHLSNS